MSTELHYTDPCRVKVKQSAAFAVELPAVAAYKSTGELVNPESLTTLNSEGYYSFKSNMVLHSLQLILDNHYRK